MTILRHNPKRDKSEPEVVATLCAHGISVERLSGKGIPDLLCGYGGRTHLVEVKTGKRNLNDNQTTFIDGWNGSPVTVLRNADEATAWAKSVRTITPMETQDGA